MREPTREDLQAVAALLPELLKVEANPAETRGGERRADGTLQMPYNVYADAADRVHHAIYKHHLLLDGFDWTAWQGEAQAFMDPQRVATASLEEVRRLLTLHVRAERFNDGHFAKMIREGHIAALLRRLGELA